MPAVIVFHEAKVGNQKDREGRVVLQNVSARHIDKLHTLKSGVIFTLTSVVNQFS